MADLERYTSDSAREHIETLRGLASLSREKGSLLRAEEGTSFHDDLAAQRGEEGSPQREEHNQFLSVLLQDGQKRRNLRFESHLTQLSPALQVAERAFDQYQTLLLSKDPNRNSEIRTLGRNTAKSVYEGHFDSLVSIQSSFLTKENIPGVFSSLVGEELGKTIERGWETVTPEMLTSIIRWYVDCPEMKGTCENLLRGYFRGPSAKEKEFRNRQPGGAYRSEKARENAIWEKRKDSVFLLDTFGLATLDFLHEPEKFSTAALLLAGKNKDIFSESDDEGSVHVQIELASLYNLEFLDKSQFRVSEIPSKPHIIAGKEEYLQIFAHATNVKQVILEIGQYAGIGGIPYPQGESYFL